MTKTLWPNTASEDWGEDEDWGGEDEWGEDDDWVAGTMAAAKTTSAS